MHRNIGKWGGISFNTFQGSYFRAQLLDHVPNCHSGRNAMGINDNIRNNTLYIVRKVLLSEGHTDSSFLSVPGSEFISDLRNSFRPNSDLYIY